jgi:conjugal transfer pilus assembly protein TraB
MSCAKENKIVAVSNLFDRWRQRGATADVSSDHAAEREDGELSPVNGELEGNERVQRRQQMSLIAVGGITMLAFGAWIFSEPSKTADPATKSETAQERVFQTPDLVNKQLTQQEWMALSGNQIDAQGNKIKALGAQTDQLSEIRAELDLLKSGRGAVLDQSAGAANAAEAENIRLRDEITRLEIARSAPAPNLGPNALYGPTSAPLYGAPPGGFAPGAVRTGEALAPATRPEVKLVAFQTTKATGNGSRPPAGTTVYSDSPDYLPANSYATATVIVGVDAKAGVQSQSDPLPVLLRLTGPARSVAENGKLLTTKLQGCLVNGAAVGDLSSEKVYIKLQKMTCPQPGGRYAVSEVNGYVAFGGKAGVRGRVVSREGTLVTQAFLAGALGGFGRGFSANTNSAFSGTSISTDGKRQKLGTGDILTGGIGEGVATAADSVSKYLIERAEQYQPVIEMPTGISVNVVFLDGVFVRN